MSRADVAFSPAVKRAQSARGSRDAYARRLASRDWSQDLPEELQRYLAARDSFYLATSSADGSPYVQHRGGPPGFLVTVDPRTLAFADFAGREGWDTPPPELHAVFAAAGDARVERVIRVHVEAWDLNCPQHITPRWSSDELAVLRVVTLQIADPDGYARYRSEMAPILARHGGRFVLDVEGGDAHVHPGDFVPDRVLLLTFPSAAAASAFYADPAYQAVRAEHFDPAVRRTAAFGLSGA